jgi:YD repeat-containing protein
MSTTSTLGFSQSVIQTPTSKTTVTYGGDPRFGMQSPLAATVQIDASDSSSSSRIERTRTVQLANPIDALSIQKLTDTITINGRAYQTVWDATARTSTTKSPQGRNTVTTFDSLGHVIKRQVGNLEPTSYTIDSNGRVIAVLRGTRTTSLTYDTSSWLASISNLLGQSTALAHDLVGRLTSITEPDKNSTTSSFDLNGNLVGVTPPGRGSHGFSYAAGKSPG